MKGARERGSYFIFIYIYKVRQKAKERKPGTINAGETLPNAFKTDAVRA